MKKSIIYSGVLALAVAGTAGLVAMNGASAETVDTSEPLSTISAKLTTAETISISKDETVYVIADASGAAQKNFVGNVLNTGDEKLPFALSVRYYLDGEEISVSDLAGKSGRVKIVFSYEATAYYQGRRVPFLAVSGLMLGDEWSEVSVTNGKLIDDGTRVTVVGYGMPGVNEDLGADILPSSFTIEAKVANFEVPTTYTLFTNEIFSEIDSSKLSSVDSLVSSMNALADGLDKIINGATDLSKGILTLKDKSGELVAGISALDEGLNQLSAKSAELNGGATAVFNSLLAQAGSTINGKIYAVFSPAVIAGYAQYGITPSEAQISEGIANALSQYGVAYPVELTIDNHSAMLEGLVGLMNTQGLDTSELVAAQKSLASYQEFYNGVLAYTDGVAEATAGADALAAGAGALISGEEELYNGSVTLLDGLSEFKESGVDKLVDFANDDLEGFARDARAMISAAGSYHYFKNSSAESVKFIVKTGTK